MAAGEPGGVDAGRRGEGGARGRVQGQSRASSETASGGAQNAAAQRAQRAQRQRRGSAGLLIDRIMSALLQAYFAELAGAAAAQGAP